MYPGNFDPDRPAYVMANAGETVSYGELEATSNQIAHLFRDKGLGRGDSAFALQQLPDRRLQGRSARAGTLRLASWLHARVIPGNQSAMTDKVNPLLKLARAIR